MADTEHPAVDTPSVIKILELLGSFDENLIITSASGRILFASYAAKEFFLSDITGRNLNEMIDDKSAAVLISEAICGNPLTLQAECNDSHLILSMLPCVGYLVITVHLSAEDSSEETLSQYSSFVDHDFRLSITSLFSALSILGSPDLTEEKRFRSLSAMNHNLHRLLRLVNNMSDLTKNSRHQWTLNAMPLDLSAFLDSLVKQITPYCQKRGVTLSAELIDSPVICNFDPSKLERALLNILSNSLMHTKENDSISLLLKKQNDKIIIRVADSGSGISEAELPYIFSRYTSPSVPELAKTSGAGFGLAISRAILELHGGSVMIESNENAGTAVILSLPDNLPQTTNLPSPLIDLTGGFSPILIELSSVFDFQEYKRYNGGFSFVFFKETLINSE